MTVTKRMQRENKRSKDIVLGWSMCFPKNKEVVPSPSRWDLGASQIWHKFKL